MPSVKKQLKKVYDSGVYSFYKGKEAETSKSKLKTPSKAGKKMTSTVNRPKMSKAITKKK
jgi:hypothetical protein